MIDLRSIEAFLAVSETRSFTAAAKRLNKTQSAVSQAIRQLEDDLGVVLIDRASRMLSLTPPGELLRNRASQLFDDAVALPALVREFGKAKLVELRFGMVDSFAIAVGPALIRSMLSESVNLSLWSDITPRLGVALNEIRTAAPLLFQTTAAAIFRHSAPPHRKGHWSDDRRIAQASLKLRNSPQFDRARTVTNPG